MSSFKIKEICDGCGKSTLTSECFIHDNPDYMFGYTKTKTLCPKCSEKSDLDYKRFEEAYRNKVKEER